MSLLITKAPSLSEKVGVTKLQISRNFFIRVMPATSA